MRSDATARILERPTSSEPSARAAEALFLGPAQVIEASGPRVRVELPDGAMADAELAMAFPYEAATGDVLLVIGKDGRHYVIGVLRGSGRASFALPGNVDLRAVGGVLSLSGDTGVAISGPEVVVETRTLRTVADTVVEKVASLYQRVTSLVRVHAKEVHTVVDETSATHAKNATITTDETVTVNGKQILLG